MRTGIDLNATVDYTLENDTDNPTVWKLGIIPDFIFTRLVQEAKGNEIEAAYNILQVTLRGWDNFNKITFETVKATLFGRELETVPLSLLDRIDQAEILELSVKAMEINSVTENESKN